MANHCEGCGAYLYSFASDLCVDCESIVEIARTALRGRSEEDES